MFQRARAAALLLSVVALYPQEIGFALTQLKLPCILEARDSVFWPHHKDAVAGRATRSANSKPTVPHSSSSARPRCIAVLSRSSLHPGPSLAADSKRSTPVTSGWADASG